jgi:tetratricopeptide (TPR) repeat protein
MSASDRPRPLTGEEAYDKGLELHRRGLLQAAEIAYRAALRMQPDHSGTLKHLGALLFMTGRFDEAARLFGRAVELAPQSGEAHNNFANALLALGRLDDAISEYEKALALDPELAAARTNLATANTNRGLSLASSGRHGEAALRFEQASRLKPDLTTAHSGLGFSLYATNKPELALASFERALALEPGNAEALRGLGLALEALGRLAEAQDALERAVAIAPASPSYRRVLAQVKRFEAGDPQISAMEELLGNASSLSDAGRIDLHFALAKAYQDIGQQDRSLAHLLAGNSAKRRLVPYDEAATLGLMRRIESVFTAEFLARHAGSGHPSGLPVFIVGMPRSGSTLIEQILASHPQVFAAGELREMAAIAGTLSGADGRSSFPEATLSLGGEQIEQLGARYAGTIAALAPGAARITDKMLSNFAFIGLIRLALPKARIIHVRRDPLDTCMSCFARLFGTSQPFSHDLGELGRYYRAYDSLMAHWGRVLPAEAMLDVSYETLVGDFENQARRLVEYCDLAWDERCRAFHQTSRPILTASAAQVRQPLYREAIGRWKSCEASLRPLLDELSRP